MTTKPELNSEKFEIDQIGYFGKLVVDFVRQDPFIQPLQSHSTSLSGLAQALLHKSTFSTHHRQILHQVLSKQYHGIALTELQKQNLHALQSKNCFTVTTAHQPNLFTGPVYFIYKILHAIRLASFCNTHFSDKHVVPIFYMGSEDADLDELGHFFLNQDKLVWATKQTGAVGRMHTQGIPPLIDEIENRYYNQPFVQPLIGLLRTAYSAENNIQQATLQLLQGLFSQFGLLVLIPDNQDLKRLFVPAMQEELLQGFSEPLLKETSAIIEQRYRVQATGRPINLFYLQEDGSRNRIEKQQDVFTLHDTNQTFSESQIIDELTQHPERFSPNVVLRGAFQETILPNIAFIGGGGEIAYWLQLKSIFQHLKLPYPVLVLRNSFLLVGSKARQMQQKLGLSKQALFTPTLSLLNQIANNLQGDQLNTEVEVFEINKQYEQLAQKAENLSPTLKEHVLGLQKLQQKKLEKLNQKMWRQARKNLGDRGRQIQRLKHDLFPFENLQERTENFIPYYCSLGPQFFDRLYAQSDALEQLFTVLDLDT